MAQKSNESIDNDLRYQILKARMEVYGYNEDEILKAVIGAAKDYNAGQTIDTKSENRQEGVNVEKLLSALDKIAKKLISYKYSDAHYILDLKEFITSDRRMIKGTHLDKVYINRTIYSVDMLINDAEDDLDASELMVLYFGIYLARIKNKEIRSVKISRRI
jgi:hypothetical protein